MRREEFLGVKLTNRNTLDTLVKQNRLYPLEKVSEITTYGVRYLRRLCHAKKIDHHRFLGRYYMTPAEVSALLQPVKKNTVTA